MIKEIHGDLFKTDSKLIVHGCNCRGSFGYGVAGIIARKYPEIKEAYLMKYEDGGWDLGDVQFVLTKDSKYIFANAATQLNYGNSARTGLRYCGYEAIESCLEHVEQYAKTHRLSVAIPKIGAGSAGGDWTLIKEIIIKIFYNSPVELTIYYLD